MEQDRQKQFREMVQDYNDRVSSAPSINLELIKDGRLICGEPCRLTMGILVLSELIGNPIFNNSGDQIPDMMDIMELLWLCRDNNINKAVNLVENPDELRRHVAKFSSGFSDKEIETIADEMSTWIGDIIKCIPTVQNDNQTNTQTIDKQMDWYIDTLDMVASEYGWDYNYIMWTLPWARVIRLCKSIVARKTGKPIIHDTTDELDNFMDNVREMQNVQS